MNRRATGVLALAGLAVATYLLRPAAPQVFGFRGATMGTTYSVKYVAAVEDAALRGAVETELAALDAVYSTYDRDSELSRLNAQPAGTPFQASAELAALLRQALSIAARTDGAFDPTIGPVIELYRFETTRDAGMPSDAELQAVLQRVGYQKLAVDERGRVTKAVAGVRVDLNAIAKGRAVDRVVEVLQQAGFAACMVEIGGETRCAGAKPDGVPWRIAVERPSTPEHPDVGVEQVVDVHDFAIAVSGSYRNFVEIDGQVVHHIPDPSTGRNAQSGVLSVAVRASDCATADALATACMVLGADAAGRVLQRFDDPALGALFQLRDAGGRISRREVSW